LIGERRHRLLIGVLLVFYGVGTVGVLSPYRELFVRLSCANLILTAALLGLAAKGPKLKLALAFGCVAVVGFATEALGVATGRIFGVYQYSGRMGPRLLGVPLVIGLNWAVLVHAVQAWLGPRLATPLAVAAVGATAMTAFDWVMEPAAVALGFWSWENQTIPLQNYAAWWGLSFLLLFVVERLRIRPDNRLAPWVLAVMLVFFGAARW